MRLHGEELILSATDLARHLGCRDLTVLDWEKAHGNLEPPSYKDPVLEQLEAKGLQFEAAYTEDLRRRGLSVVECGMEAGTGKVRELMQQGMDVICQAPLRGQDFAGIADFLHKVPVPSDLGNWSYEVYDTKLARNTRAGTILQLSLYSELLGVLQGHTPEWMHVVKPGDGFVHERYRVDDYGAYYRFVQQRLRRFVAELSPGTGTAAGFCPPPVPQCDICNWWAHCADLRRSADHLCLVAGMSTLHTAEFRRQGIATLTQLGDRDQGLPERPERGNEDAYQRLWQQARIQLEGRRSGGHRYELLPVEADRGFLRLPEPSPGDVFFDIEGARFVDDGGLEYLLGYCVRSTGGALSYHARWCLDRGEERGGFEEFIDAVMARLRDDPGMHVYHFAPYEPTAMKRLMGRYATREDDVDRLLRGGRFVDLHAVAKQAARASVESYGLKQLEAVFGFTRRVDLREASLARRRLECCLELDEAGAIDPEDRAVVLGYNREDCEATAALRDWLEVRRNECIAAGTEVPRPVPQSGDPSEGLEARRADVQAVYDSLTADLPPDPREHSREQHARWLLAEMLEYHRRENKCAWWEFHRIHDLEHQDLLDERKVATGLRFVAEVDGGTAACPIHRYEYPDQELAVDEDDDLYEVGERDPKLKLGRVAAVDPAARTIDIKKTKRSARLHPSAALSHADIGPWVKASSLLALARSVVDHGIDGDGPFRAGRDLLLRLPPRRPGCSGDPLVRDGEPLAEAAIRAVNQLDQGLLPVQGPPGTGKTYIGARMIVDLARQGRRVGVTAVSHKVIVNLLDNVRDAAAETGVTVHLARKISSRDTPRAGHIREATSKADALAELDAGRVLGGTAWLWSDDDAVESLDYLFVDEAGQMAIADVLAVSRAARNLVLLGDPQQLEQPQQGTHPDGTEVAALVHVLGGHDVIEPEMGLFFPETWRLHPAICAFTSQLYYEGKLQSLAGLGQQALGGPTAFAGSGLFVVPVPHEGNQSSAPEEVDAVQWIVDDLLQQNVTWTDGKGVTGRLEEKHILVVTPYNAQIAALRRRLPGLAIGTVDKFQGQQAPVVIYSMASSSPEDAPRGLSFLYSPNRLNVATSRARCACVLVASPRLFEPDCRTPEQMRWANGLCLFRELAKGVELPR